MSSTAPHPEPAGILLVDDMEDSTDEAAVFGAADERLGEVPVAVVHRRADSSLDEEDLRDFLKGRLAAFKIPARMIFSPEPLPRLGTGKIDRVELKEKHGR